MSIGGVHLVRMKRTDGSSSIGLSELRGELGKIVDRAAGGEEILITERGRPVARLVPVESRLEELIRSGKVRLPTRPLVTLEELGEPIKARGSVSDLIER
jgi:prevent-host-death family protein